MNIMDIIAIIALILTSVNLIITVCIEYGLVKSKKIVTIHNVDFKEIENPEVIDVLIDIDNRFREFHESIKEINNNYNKLMTKNK